MDMERWTDDLPAGRHAGLVRARYEQPPRWSQAGQVDRRQEGDHVVAVRQAQRDAIEGAAVQAKQAYVELARQEKLQRINTEAKYKLLRARKESQVLASDDAELTAKFALLDDDLFLSIRLGGLPYR